MSISNPTDRKKINDAMDEISNSMTRMDAERDLIKNIVKDTCENYELDKKKFRKLARHHHLQNFGEEQANFAELEALYDSLRGGKVSG